MIKWSWPNNVRWCVRTISCSQWSRCRFTQGISLMREVKRRYWKGGRVTFMKMWLVLNLLIHGASASVRSLWEGWRNYSKTLLDDEPVRRWRVHRTHMASTLAEKIFVYGPIVAFVGLCYWGKGDKERVIIAQISIKFSYSPSWLVYSLFLVVCTRVVYLVCYSYSTTWIWMVRWF